MDNIAIEISNLVKYYDGRCILDGIDLKIPKGCIYGLLGRNGIGKTTLIRILLGLEPASRGRTFVSGRESRRLTARERGRIGYVAEGHNLMQHMKVSALVELCRKLSLHWSSVHFGELCETFRLPMDRRVRDLSTGMRAQLNLALAMAIEPEVLILDDPTLGLDTVARRQFLELAIDVIQRDGRTILFSSHILSDVERIADRIGVLAGGKLVVDCSLEALKRRIRKLQIVFEDAAPDDLHLTEIVRQQRSEKELVITVANWNEAKRAVVDTFKPIRVAEIPMTLEDLFIECTNPVRMPMRQ